MRRDVRANHQKIGTQFFHQIELAFGTFKRAGALGFGHAFKIAERLEGDQFQTKVTDGLADIFGGAIKGQKVIFKNLDTVKTSSGNGIKFFLKIAR